MLVREFSCPDCKRVHSFKVVPENINEDDNDVVVKVISLVCKKVMTWTITKWMYGELQKAYQKEVA